MNILFPIPTSQLETPYYYIEAVPNIITFVNIFLCFNTVNHLFGKYALLINNLCSACLVKKQTKENRSSLPCSIHRCYGEEIIDENIEVFQRDLSRANITSARESSHAKIIRCVR